MRFKDRKTPEFDEEYDKMELDMPISQKSNTWGT